MAKMIFTDVKKFFGIDDEQRDKLVSKLTFVGGLDRDAVSNILMVDVHKLAIVMKDPQKMRELQANVVTYIQG